MALASLPRSRKWGTDFGTPDNRDLWGGQQIASELVRTGKGGILTVEAARRGDPDAKRACERARITISRKRRALGLKGVCWPVPEATPPDTTDHLLTDGPDYAPRLTLPTWRLRGDRRTA